MNTCPPTFSTMAKERIEIQSKVRVEDHIGGRSTSWETAYYVWAIIFPRRPREFVLNNSIVSRASTDITIRYIDALSNTTETAKYRIIYKDRQYNIEGIQNLKEINLSLRNPGLLTEGRTYQKIRCTEGEVS